MTVKQIAMTGGKIALSIGVLYIVMKDMDLAAVWARLDGSAMVGLIIGVVLFLIQALGVAERWRLVLSVHGEGIPLRAAWYNVMLGLFFNQALPSTIGGDAARVWDARRENLTLTMAARTVLVDRIVGFVGLMAFCAVGLPYLYLKAEDPRVALGIFILIGGGLVVLAILLAFRHMPHKFRRGPIKVAVALSDTSWRCMATPGLTRKMLFYSVLPQIKDVLVLWVLIIAIGADATLWQVALIFPAVTFAATIPISVGGWGLREGAMVLAFGLIAMPGEDALAASLLFGLTTLVTGLIGGAVWVLSNPRRARALRDEGLGSENVGNGFEATESAGQQQPSQEKP
ncbi:MAG: lysylphosphatidylglycerol synthase transmembrane domain-containing protein [Rhodospirillaceae bacterium]